MIQIKSIVTPEYKSNTYLIIDKDTKRLIVIDPTVFSTKTIEDYIDLQDLQLDYIIPTHGHFDHIEGISVLYEKYKLNIVASNECISALSSPKKNYSFYYKNKNLSITIPGIIFQEDNYELSWNHNSIQIIKTPGHSPCSVCIIVDNSILFSGDTILIEYNPFSKFPDGDSERLITSLKRIYNKYPHSMMVYPGHGDPFTLGKIGYQFAFLQ